jgi:hypothetical protein
MVSCETEGPLALRRRLSPGLPFREASWWELNTKEQGRSRSRVGAGCGRATRIGTARGQVERWMGITLEISASGYAIEG